jgi:uncharacterized membrane protein YsdA (DUF1294 family)
MLIGAAAYLGVVAVMSLICFIAYGFDKRRAVRGGRRVPERTLHFLSFMGGWPGAFLGQRHFRHKTQKLAFLRVFWLDVFLHIVIVGAVVSVIAGPGYTALCGAVNFLEDAVLRMTPTPSGDEGIRITPEHPADTDIRITPLRK